MTIYTNPKWLNAQNTAVQVTIDGTTPWSISLPTEEPTAKQVAADAIAGVFGPIAEFVPPPPVVPSSITMRQCRLQLLVDGLLDAVDAAIAGMPSPQKEAAEIEWEYSAVVQRTSPLIAGLAPALGLTEEDVDNLFIAASAL